MTTTKIFNTPLIIYTPYAYGRVEYYVGLTGKNALCPALAKMLLSKNNFKDHEKAGVTRLATWAKWGGIWTDARVCLHYWVVNWFAGYFNSPYIAQFMGCVISRIHYGLRSYSASDILLPTIIIIIEECSQALKICKCLWSLSCGGVSNKLLVLSITFHFHYYIWGCMCSIGSLQFRWLRGYIHS